MLNSNNGYAMPSLADIAAVTGADNNGFGNVAGIIWLVVILAMFNGNGFGGWGNGSNADIAMKLGDVATNQSVQSAVDTMTTNSKLDTIGSDINNTMFTLNNAVSGGFSALNTSLCSSFDSVINAITTLGFNMQAGDTQLGYAIESLKSENAQNTNAIIQASNANTQRILDIYTQNTIQELRDRVQNAEFQNNQTQQTSTIIAALANQTAAATATSKAVSS